MFYFDFIDQIMKILKRTDNIHESLIHNWNDVWFILIHNWNSENQIEKMQFLLSIALPPRDGIRDHVVALGIDWSQLFSLNKNERIFKTIR